MTQVSRKYEDIDKAISKKIMKELEGQTIEHLCPDCHGEGTIGFDKSVKKCKNCGGSGNILIQY